MAIRIKSKEHYKPVGLTKTCVKTYDHVDKHFLLHKLPDAPCVLVFILFPQYKLGLHTRPSNLIMKRILSTSGSI